MENRRRMTMPTEQAPGKPGGHMHINRILDTIDMVDSGTRLIVLNMAVQTAQAQIAGHDTSIASERWATS